MQTSQSFGIHFTTRPDKVKDGKEPIYACVKRYASRHKRLFWADSALPVPNGALSYKRSR